jgi:hypothetical protein
VRHHGGPDIEQEVKQCKKALSGFLSSLGKEGLDYRAFFIIVRPI